MKLRTKIILGFAIVLLLLAVMGVVSLLQFSAASTGFSQYRNLARDTNLAGRLQANMLMVRMNVKDFIISGEEKEYKEYSDYLEIMNSFLEESQVEIEKPERAALIDQMDDLVNKYETSFEKVYNFRAVRNDHVKNYLEIYGPKMEIALNEILISAEEDGDMVAAYYSSLTLKHLLLARIYATKFLENNDAINIDRVAEEFSKTEDYIHILDSELENPTRRQHLKEAETAKAVYIEHFDEVVTIIQTRNDTINNELDVWGPQIATWVEDVKLSIKQEQDTLGPRLQAENRRANILIIIILSSAILLSILITMITINSILKQLGADPADLQEIAEAIAGGNLKGTAADSDDSIRGVYRSMITMKQKLTEIVSVVLGGTEQIATASEQLASGNQDLSNRTEQQASALEETSSAIEEMNSSIKSNADNTGSADQLSRDAVVRTEEGGQAVSKMVGSMNEISESSNKIADIIEVITNIAFQTNLLALNASIEAARAGEHGKGFAVVAVEVRKLAKRSDKAAEEITSIIKNSNQKVEEGVDIANSAGQVLEEINAAVKKVTTLVSEISAASQEQLSSVDQIDRTLSSLDENTQKNAALVEEAASSTEELSAQAQELNTSMQFFKLDSFTGRSAQKTISRKKSPNLLVEPAKSENPASGSHSTPGKSGKDGSSDVYESFSDLVDGGEFDEF